MLMLMLTFLYYVGKLKACNVITEIIVNLIEVSLELSSTHVFLIY